MDFKPNEFFIGLVEFITILLPGAMLTLIVLLVETNHPVQANYVLYQYAFSNDTNIIFWVAIIFSSFGLGYFLSSIASGLDPLYDAIRKQFYPYEEDLRLGSCLHEPFATNKKSNKCSTKTNKPKPISHSGDTLPMMRQNLKTVCRRLLRGCLL